MLLAVTAGLIAFLTLLIGISRAFWFLTLSNPESGLFFVLMLLCTCIVLAIEYVIFDKIYESYFSDSIIQCEECNETFDDKDKQSKFTYVFGKAYIEYQCPYCNSII